MVIGLFAGVGCGKSEILNILKEDYCFKVLEADKIVHYLYDNDLNVLSFVVDLLGVDVLDVEKKLNRKKMAEILYADKSKLNILNKYIHPKVWDYIKEYVNKNRMIYNIVIEAALLPDDKNIYDKVWTIKVPLSIRKERLKINRGYTEEKIMNILLNQPSDEEYMLFSDYAIDNSKDRCELKKSIKEALRGYKI